MSDNKFIMEIAVELIKSVNNNYEDNYDFYRYGEVEPSKKKEGSLKTAFISLINRQGYFNNFNSQLFSNEIKNNDFPFTDFMYLYNHLQDDYSKELLVKIIVYRLLGYKKVKLPLNTPEFWNNQLLIESHQNKDDFIDIDFMNIRMPLIDLTFIGFPIKMYSSALGINIDFIIKQYEFHRGGIDIEALPGDTVIDAGGCFGDTALYFSYKVSKSGQVHVFEFIPDNIKIFEKNIDLNSELNHAIRLIPNPVWSKSDEEVYYLSSGPGSKVSMEAFEGYTGKTKTLSIDDYRNRNKIPKIDFIKMDIEGAELNALKGAIETIKAFKPKLAIALYHSTSDFGSIPQFINELNLGYRFYLSHATIYGEETMLFATTEK